MKSVLSASTVLAASLLAASISHAEVISFNTSKAYVGGGVNINRIDTFSGSDGEATGFQVFAGYEYGELFGFDVSGEIGFIDTENFYDGMNDEADGLWVSGVAVRGLPEIDTKLSAVVRCGLGLDGDDGMLMGFGAQYQVHPKVIVRAEYLNKDLTQSYQLNAAYQF